jgi:CheY-like chemotaxis protein
MAGASQPVSVLLVEDEVLISNLVADWLSERGFAVHEVTTGDAALRYLESGAAVDVLFTDVDLPGGIGGAELAQRAREQRPELPIIYASGRYRASDLGTPVSRSMFLAKPYDRDDVCTLLERLTSTAH